jgi:hypothetical protein
MNSSPEIVENLLRGIVDSMAFIAQPENKPAVLKSLAKGLRLTNVEQAVEGYESLPMLYDKRIYPRVDGVRNVIRLLGATNEKNPPPKRGGSCRRSICEKTREGRTLPISTGTSRGIPYENRAKPPPGTRKI